MIFHYTNNGFSYIKLFYGNFFLHATTLNVIQFIFVLKWGKRVGDFRKNKKCDFEFRKSGSACWKSYFDS